MNLSMKLARLSRGTYNHIQKVAEHVCNWGQKFLVRVYYNKTRGKFIATQVDSNKDRWLEEMITTKNKQAYKYTLVGTYSKTANYNEVLDDLVYEANNEDQVPRYGG